MFAQKLTKLPKESYALTFTKVLHQRLDTLKEKTPELEELHFDGA